MEFLSKLDKINRELIPFIIPFLFISYLKMQKKSEIILKKRFTNVEICGREGKDGQEKKKEFTLSRLTERENPISFLKDFLLPGERRNKRELGELSLFVIVKRLSYYKFY